MADMRIAYKNESELREIAQEMSQKIYMRSEDTFRQATEEESKVLYNVLYGALFTVNETGNSFTDRDKLIILHDAENIADNFFPDMNGYQTVYLPLDRFIDKWHEESLDKFSAVVREDNYNAENKADDREVSARWNDVNQTDDKIDEKKVTEEKLQRIKEILTELVRDNTDEYRCYKIEPSSYNDYIDDRTIAEQFEKYRKDNDGFDSFENYLNEYFLDQLMTNGFGNPDDYFISDLKEKAEKAFRGTDLEDVYNDNVEFEFEEYLHNECGYEGISFNLAHFLDNDYHFNVMFKTDIEQNYDMGAICDYYKIPDRFTYDEPVNDKRYDNSLTYLIKQQGHNPMEVINTFHRVSETDSKFVQSVSDELDNMTYEMSELTALVSLSGENVYKFLDAYESGKGSITLSKNTMIGLFNEWNGSGSILEIELEKDAVFPVSMIRNVQIEGQRSDYIHGYTVNDVYGLVGSAWTQGELTIGTEEINPQDVIGTEQSEELDMTQQERGRS